MICIPNCCGPQSPVLDLNRQFVFKKKPIFGIFDQNKGDAQRIIDINLKQSSDPSFCQKIKLSFKGVYEKNRDFFKIYFTANMMTNNTYYLV